MIGEILAGSGRSPCFAGEGVIKSSEHMETSAMVFSRPCIGDVNKALWDLFGGRDRLFDLVIGSSAEPPKKAEDEGEILHPPELPPAIVCLIMSGCMFCGV